jgi:hypothetical protein
MELSNEEKIAIIDQHIKNVLINIFNLQLSIVQEESSDEINASAIEDLNNKISHENNKVESLVSQKSLLVE